MALLPLVEMGTAQPIITGYDILRPIIDFLTIMYNLTIAVVQLRTIVVLALIKLSCAYKRTNLLTDDLIDRKHFRKGTV